MSRLFGDRHRQFQDMFESRPLADRIEDIALKTEFDDLTRGFVEAQDMFFLATTDDRGRPTCSYKGGAPGFVRVTGPSTLVFPSYNGNGMFLSVGNIAETHHVGMLFIDFETPNRLRVQGEAEVADDPDLLECYEEAELVIRVNVTEIWPNCPRYVHHYKRVRDSRYVPRANCETPVAEWKRVDGVQDVIDDRDRRKVEAAGGTITQEEWFDAVGRGEG
ncbi:Pyridoxamine 5'-phosphate oxidase [Methyloligella halotolerans]|uniref:Pyridoxamine 5'-phosphate oxidase n=1 Tax=Methyloligella halotolerans TaxID=1177755 RepID=A0A1E2RZB1_9HYPH|nr:pyridoxamine 5'-phosphate oxidase family protein [Methyloligella halotolerans]ODA67554.1 Pyridoxamine 5'-phosphate oxidase [Methyloligella halotolerans]